MGILFSKHNIVSDGKSLGQNLVNRTAPILNFLEDVINFKLLINLFY